MSKKKKNLEIHVTDKVKITDAVNIKFLQTFWGVHPVIFWILLMLLYGCNFIAIFFIEGIIGRIILFVLSIISFLWGPVLYEKTIGRKKVK